MVGRSFLEAASTFSQSRIKKYGIYGVKGSRREENTIISF